MNMKLILDSHNFPKDIRGTAMTLGNFDGVHLGHQELIRITRERASEHGVKSLFYTFDPHPVKVLAPKHCPPLLQTLDQKLRSIEGTKIDICVVEPFNSNLARLSAESFFRKILLERLSAKVIVVGYDFTFGMHRQGTVEALEKFGESHDVEIIVVDAQFHDETLVSSTNIRKILLEGDVKSASNLLGRPYCIEGKVISGRGIGGTLEAHTANIETENEIIPKNGVYITKTSIWQEDESESRNYPSVTSIGDNPTFPIACFAIETHLIDANVDIIGWNARVEFIMRTRDQIAFPSQDDLRKQIQRDIEEAREYHSCRPSTVDRRRKS